MNINQAEKKLIAFEVFKGFRDKEGKVKRLRAIGVCQFDPDLIICFLTLNGVRDIQYVMEPEADPTTLYDFNIYREVAENEKEPVGVGYLMTGINAGLVQLEWDFFGTKDVYISLSFKNPEGGISKVAA